MPVMGRQPTNTYRIVMVLPINGSIESHGTLYVEVLEYDGEPVGVKPYRVVRASERGRSTNGQQFTTLPDAIVDALKTQGFGEYELHPRELMSKIYDELGWDQ